MSITTDSSTLLSKLEGIFFFLDTLFALLTHIIGQQLHQHDIAQKVWCDSRLCEVDNVFQQGLHEPLR